MKVIKKTMKARKVDEINGERCEGVEGKDRSS